MDRQPTSESSRGNRESCVSYKRNTTLIVWASNFDLAFVSSRISLRFTLKIKCESSLKRLQAIEQNLQASKTGIISAYQSSDFKSYFMLLIPTLLRRYAINSTIRNGSMVSSIFPVTNQVVKLEGRQILELTSTIGAFGNSGKTTT